MSEHKMLKEICDTIRYRVPYFSYQGAYIISNADMYSEVGVREIIFTQEFMDKFLSFLEDKWKAENSYTEGAFIGVHIRILDSLDDPTTYLYNLLGLGEKC